MTQALATIAAVALLIALGIGLDRIGSRGIR